MISVFIRLAILVAKIQCCVGKSCNNRRQVLGLGVYFAYVVLRVFYSTVKTGGRK